jgi:1,4-alpha-glucan branching enzyme
MFKGLNQLLVVAKLQLLLRNLFKKVVSTKAINQVQPTVLQKYEEQFFIDTALPVWNYSLFSDEDVTNFQQGTHYRLYEFFGNKQITVLGESGTYFAVWAPNATYVSVIGYFNEWDTTTNALFVRKEGSGIWEGFIPNVLAGEAYKYHIIGFNGLKLDKGDPFAHLWKKDHLLLALLGELFMNGMMKCG